MQCQIVGISKIEWTHRSHNVIDGCTPKGPECDHCYAARLTGTRHKHLPATIRVDGKMTGRPFDVDTQLVTDGKRADLVSIGKTRDLGDGKRLDRYIYNGRVSLNVSKLQAALKIPKNGGMHYPRTSWCDVCIGGAPGLGLRMRCHGTLTREVADRSKPKVPVGNRVFWNHMSDTFHESLTNEEIAAQFAVMAARPDLRFLVLTKRPERALTWFGDHPHHRDVRAAAGGLVTTDEWLYNAIVHRWPTATPWPLPNVALGVSAGTQRMVDERLPILLQIPVHENGMRFWSAEPLLEPIALFPRGFGRDTEWMRRGRIGDCSCGHGHGFDRCPNYGGVATTCHHSDCSCTSWWPKGLHQVIIGAESGPARRHCKLSWIQDLGSEVLNAQIYDTEQGAAGPRRHGESARVEGPALFIKQADVCESCAGQGYAQNIEGLLTGRPCTTCQGTGQTGKVRKGCPEIFIPGHGTKSWQQFPTGWTGDGCK